MSRQFFRGVAVIGIFFAVLSGQAYAADKAVVRFSLNPVVTGDLLSAASLLMAVLAMLLSVWNSDITIALGRKKPTMAADRDPYILGLRAALGRALPLTLGAWATLGLLLPITWAALRTSQMCWGNSACGYDPLAAAFLVTQFLVLIFAIFSAIQTWAIVKKLLGARK
mgnify:CR=1 FL=1